MESRPVSKACNTCHSKRSKCDGKQPCSACIARKIPGECSYSRVQKKRGVPKGTESAVHKRLRQLEELLKSTVQGQAALLGADSMISEPSASLLSSVSALQTPPAIWAQTPNPATSRAPQQQFSYAPDFLGTLVAPGPNFQLLSDQISRSLTGAAPIPFPQIGGSAPMATDLDPNFSMDDMFTQELFPAFISYDEDTESGLKEEDFTTSTETGSPSSGSGSGSSSITVYPGFEVEVSIPKRTDNVALDSMPHDLVTALFANFFTTCYTLAPIFHLPSFFPTIASRPPILLYAMMALSAKTCDHPLTEPDALFEKAREELGMELDSGGSVDLARALHIMTLFSMASGGLRSLSYIYAALGTRLCFDLKLNIEPYPADLTFVEQETRRRVFWVTYGIDRLQTVAGNRPLAVQDSECRLRLPINELIWEGALSEGNGVVRVRKETGDMLMQGSFQAGLVPTAEGDGYLFPQGVLQEAAQTVLEWIDSSKKDPSTNPMRTRPGVLDPFSYYIILSNLYGKVHAFHSDCQAANINPFSPSAPTDVVAKLKSLDATLQEWFNAIPEYFRILSGRTFRQRLFALGPEYREQSVNWNSYHTALMHLFFHSIRIVLHRPRKLEEMARDYEWLASDSFVRCTESADSMAGLVGDLLRQEDRKLQSLSSASMFLVFQAALIELLFVRNLNPKAAEPGIGELVDAARAKVELHTQFLEEMAKSWRGEPLLADLLKRLARDVTLPLATDGPEILQLRGR